MRRFLKAPLATELTHCNQHQRASSRSKARRNLLSASFLKLRAAEKAGFIRNVKRSAQLRAGSLKACYAQLKSGWWLRALGPTT